MDGMLSQDEINALLNGMDVSEDEGESAAEAGSSDAPSLDAASVSDIPDVLTDVEKDAIGEVANISMGSSATTLYSLLNRKVNITTPTVTCSRWESLLA